MSLLPGIEIDASDLSFAPRIGIAISQFNRPVVDLLERGCMEALDEAGLAPEQVTLVRVPGAFELPLVCQRLAQSGQFDAVIALGAVIRGETPHFDYVAEAVERGVLDTQLSFELPVIFGVLTTDTGEQAYQRARPEAGDKGGAAARAALEMISVLQQIDDLLPRQDA